MNSQNKGFKPTSTGETNFPHEVNRDPGDIARQEFSNLALGTGHQLNNLVASFQGRLELIQHYFDSSELHQHTQVLALITQRTKELASILVEFNQKHLLEPEVVQCIEIANYLEAAVVVEHPVSFLVSCSTDASIEVDFRLLVMVLRNLISNSERSICGSAGTIELNFLENTQDSELDNRSLVSISIVDTGSGFTEADLLSASQPYYSTNSFDDAQGLGLTLARFFALEFDGYIDICNIADGAQVSLVLPIAKTRGN